MNKIIVKPYVEVEVICECCGNAYYVNVAESDLMRFIQGGYVQECFPYLTREERELLISNTCSKCWALMFPIADEQE